MNAQFLASPQVRDLTDAVAEYKEQQGCSCSPIAAHTFVVGLLQLLKIFTTDYAQAGDIGRHTDGTIARAVGWEHDAAWLIARLVKFGFVQEHDEHRLIVPDWPQQADKSCHQYVADQGITFADGTPTRRKPRRNSPADLRKHAEEAAEDSRPAAHKMSQRRDSNGESPLFEPPAGSTITRGSFSAHRNEEPPAVVHDFRPKNPPEGHRRLEPITRKEMQTRGLLGPDGEFIPVNFDGNEESATTTDARFGS